MYIVTARQLSSCTFLFAAHAAYPKDVHVVALILSCFVTSLIVHRPRKNFTLNITFADYIDPVLAHIWWILGLHKAIVLLSIRTATALIGVLLCEHMRKKYPYKSPKRNFYHCSLHILAVVGTLCIYYR